ncbi:hypothetical protein C8R43DRAFT_1101343 [Mycena crocata]|nr:hypothetical protein C8R43DRAFT_1101343 [Mycena crocata]
MIAIPQELVDAILSEVDDSKTLEACSLTVSNWRDTSQRCLLHSLTVGGDHWARTYSAAGEMFAQSPRIAGYITSISFQFVRPPSDITTLQALFDKLVNVRRCTLRGTGSGCPWNEIVAPLFPWVLGFLRQQELSELHVMFFGRISRAQLAILLTCASTLSFYDVGVARVTDSSVDVGGLGTSIPKMEQLLVPGSHTVSDAISQPQFAPYRANLRRLGLTPSPQYSRALILSTASTLQHLRLDCTSTVHILSAIPVLPSLRALEVVIGFGEQNTAHLVKLLSALLPSVPTTLEEIILTYSSHWRAFKSSDKHYAALDLLLVKCHPAVPRVRWRLELEEEGEEARRQLSHVTRLVKLALPKLHAKGKLVVERYLLGGELGEWAIR